MAIEQLWIKCKVCGDRKEFVDTDYPQIWICDNCEIFTRCNVCGLYFKGDGWTCNICKIQEEYDYRMSIGDIEL